jgi:hypothetical protein
VKPAVFLAFVMQFSKSKEINANILFYVDETAAANLGV